MAFRLRRSIRARSGFRVLHRVGSCYRRPGLDYLEYESHGGSLPAAHRFDAACKLCFRGMAPVDGEDSATTGSSSDEPDT